MIYIEKIDLSRLKVFDMVFPLAVNHVPSYAIHEDDMTGEAGPDPVPKEQPPR